MKIAIVGPSNKFQSGVSHFTRRLSTALNADPILFRNMLPKFMFPGHNRITGNEGTVDWYNPITWILAAMRCNKADVVVFQWWTSSVAHMYLFISLMVKRPIIIEFHEVVDPMEQSVLPLRIYSRWMAKAIRNRANRFVTHSTVDRELISNNYNIPVDRIAVIPIGLFDQYTRAPKEKGTVILFFGLIRPYKGVKYLIEAFNQIPDATLLIVGEVWEDKEVRLLIALSPARDRITLVDHYTSTEETSTYFSMADVLVLPYTRASQSGVAHIGMALGVPIVASYVGGLTESLVNYTGNTFVEPGNADQLKDAIVKALQGERYFPPPEELKWENVTKEWEKLIHVTLSD